ncbi:hypothetical protein [Paenibacillus beijingensis]|uniref:Uncharacterized protein n=1 Tax=Paenibacillus beijingensis TaxID=1126833 RepID=A0A0D5NF31_9BACL|nr:hypothetical protein [Paenibacillus beijingensis]AJY73846.1 hypothetical protein VN24_03470 [Paenibacillus beijingensis]
MVEDKDRKQRFEQAVKLHQRGVNGEKKAAADAYKLLAELRAAEPSNARLEAYYGSTLTLMARDALQPLEKADKAQQGLNALDRAVSMDPDRIEIRLIRANVCLRLPEDFFHRSKTAIEDFSFLLARYETNPGLFSKEQLIQILNNLGASYRNAGKPNEANAVSQRLAQLDPKS